MRLTVAGVFICSSIVGILWGANLGAIYPVVEIIFQGQSMHDWSERQLTQSRQRSQELQKQIAELDTDKQATPSKSKEDERQIKKLKTLRSQLAAEQSAIANVEWISPYIERYLPDDAFQTLIIVVGLLIVAGAVKACAHVANAVLVTRLSESTKKQLRIQCYNKLLETDLPTLSNNASGKLLSRITNEVDKAINGVGILFGRTLREPFKLLVCLAGAAWISWRLLLLALIVTPLAIVLTGLIAKSIRRASGRFLQQTSEMYCLIGESLTSMWNLAKAN